MSSLRRMFQAMYQQRTHRSSTIFHPDQVLNRACTYLLYKRWNERTFVIVTCRTLDKSVASKTVRCTKGCNRLRYSKVYIHTHFVFRNNACRDALIMFWQNNHWLLCAGDLARCCPWSRQAGRLGECSERFLQELLDATEACQARNRGHPKVRIALSKTVQLRWDTNTFHTTKPESITVQSDVWYKGISEFVPKLPLNSIVVLWFHGFTFFIVQTEIFGLTCCIVRNPITANPPANRQHHWTHRYHHPYLSNV